MAKPRRRPGIPLGELRTTQQPTFCSCKFRTSAAGRQGFFDPRPPWRPRRRDGWLRPLRIPLLRLQRRKKRYPVSTPKLVSSLRGHSRPGRGIVRVCIPGRFVSLVCLIAPQSPVLANAAREKLKVRTLGTGFDYVVLLVWLSAVLSLAGRHQINLPASWRQSPRVFSPDPE